MAAAHDAHPRGCRPNEAHQQGDDATTSLPVASKVDDADATPIRDDPAATDIKLDNSAMRPRSLAPGQAQPPAMRPRTTDPPWCERTKGLG